MVWQLVEMLCGGTLAECPCPPLPVPLFLTSRCPCPVSTRRACSPGGGRVLRAGAARAAARALHLAGQPMDRHGARAGEGGWGPWCRGDSRLQLSSQRDTCSTSQLLLSGLLLLYGRRAAVEASPACLRALPAMQVKFGAFLARLQKGQRYPASVESAAAELTVRASASLLSLDTLLRCLHGTRSPAPKACSYLRLHLAAGAGAVEAGPGGASGAARGAQQAQGRGCQGGEGAAAARPVAAAAVAAGQQGGRAGHQRSAPVGAGQRRRCVGRWPPGLGGLALALACEIHSAGLFS